MKIIIFSLIFVYSLYLVPGICGVENSVIFEKADKHYELKDYEEAILAYAKVLREKPESDLMAYGIYQIGNCYFEQMTGPEYDQTPTKSAIRAYNVLVDKFPESSYVKDAEQKINQAFHELAGHELGVGMFYFKMKKYKAALGRFEGLVRDFPDTGVHHEAIKHISLCREKLNLF